MIKFNSANVARLLEAAKEREDWYRQNIGTPEQASNVVSNACALTEWVHIRNVLEAELEAVKALETAPAKARGRKTGTKVIGGKAISPPAPAAE